MRPRFIDNDSTYQPPYNPNARLLVELEDEDDFEVEIDELDEITGDPRLAHRPGLLDSCAE